MQIPQIMSLLALSLTIPLWDWGERKSRIKASQASIETANINFDGRTE